MDSGLSSEIDCFDTKDAPSRILSVDGLKNVRDAGGWRTDSGKSVRYGMIYRGSQMNGYNQGARLTERGRDTMIRDLKIKSEVDLRRPDRDDGGQTECAIDGSYPYLKAPFHPYTCIFPQFKTSERGYDLRVPQCISTNIRIFGRPEKLSRLSALQCGATERYDLIPAETVCSGYRMKI